MSQRLHNINNSITSNTHNRIIQYRTSFPLDRNQIRDYIYTEKYRKIIDQCFNIIVDNRHIFKHGDIEEYDRPTER